MAGRWTRSAQAVLVHAVLIVITLATVYPVLQVIGISLRPQDRLYSTSLRIIPEDATTGAYRRLLVEKDFLLWLRNSLIVSAWVTLVGIALAAAAGYAFSRYRFPGRKIGLQTFLLTQMFPATMLLLPLYVLMRRLGLVDTLMGLVIAYVATALPFCVWTMKGYYDTIPRELEQAALVDGSTRIGAFFRVVLPLAAPALTITGLFAFMTGWSEFIVARVILSSSTLFTLPLGLEGLSGTYQTEWATYAAGSVLVSLPVVGLFLAINRFLVGGLTLGGIKG